MTVIRDATPDDAPRFLEIYRYYIENTAVTYECAVPSEAEFRARIEGTLQRYPYLVVEDGGVILGYAYAGPLVRRAAADHSCEVSIYLDRDARRRGLGRQLYEALEARLKALGIRNLYAVIAWPPGEDDPYLTTNSADFHARLGYVPAGHLHKCGCKFGRWYDLIWMEKFIGPHENEAVALFPPLW